jgi:hypothetical protein
MSDDDPGADQIWADLRGHFEQRDPVPDGLVARMQAAAALAASDGDLDLELMLLVERSEELAGTRGVSATAYTLRFAHGGVDLLLRVSTSTDGARVDGWVVPPAPLTVRVLRGEEETAVLEVGGTGRFELADQPPGLLRLRLDPDDGSTPFITPAFEI